MTVGKVGSANAGYYESAVVAGVEDYYAGAGEAPGCWIGRADLVGAVAGSLATAVDAALLLEAKCAPDGTRLGKTPVTDRSVTAFDLTFSAPKSVSVLFGVGGRATAIGTSLPLASRMRLPMLMSKPVSRSRDWLSKTSETVVRFASSVAEVG